MQKFEINNPVALKFIADFKSGLLWAPIVAKIKQYRLYIISVCIFLVLMIFFLLGRTLFRSSTIPSFLPPQIEKNKLTTEITPKSEFDNIRQEIFNFSTDLPDPVIPPFDNNINLEVNQNEIQVW